MQIKIMVIMTIVDDIDIDHIKDILKTLTPPSIGGMQTMMIMVIVDDIERY